MLHPVAALGRLGTESAFEVLARAQALAERGRSIVNLGIGQPDFPTPEHIVEAGIKALRDGHHGYTPAAGVTPLREAVAAELEKRAGRPLDPGRVLIEPGGKPTMFFAILAFGEPGAEILYPDPGFPIYRSAIEFTGAKAVPLPLKEENGFGFSAEDVLSRIAERTRLIILNSPANPTGGVTGKAEVERLVAGLAAWPEVAILSDEIYSRILYDGREHASLMAYPELDDRLILLDGWSKTYAMTGWRIGYAYWPKALVESAVRLAVNCHSCVNAATQWAGLAALTGPQDSVERMVAAFDERRRAVVRGLNAIDGISCVEPGGAFYAFPNISGTGLAAKRLETALLEEAGVATIAGTSFGVYGEGYLRLSYANSLDNILEALQRIERWLQERRAA
ncbi:Aspartate/methionine/tyrosine aminotransferase [Tistlia consotensis]|uniref:aspartate transaminase n=1 Tax=Tistlia consotensis USBA 355 TaxID=560819 RepID=A0A1Y6BRF0_9PROT|nr:pyridoxal phosphate-dependent aminotransferase [Tistlia consotensis]SMF24402.1 Aspartate/methionine/tyrosine aminotransferase [Tistlia consotensis USBA 355]SNR60566.1 Aspartate/methionine/tyrosine aminotransferase [Tistlia consotensis]